MGAFHHENERKIQDRVKGKNIPQAQPWLLSEVEALLR